MGKGTQTGARPPVWPQSLTLFGDNGVHTEQVQTFEEPPYRVSCARRGCITRGTPPAHTSRKLESSQTVNIPREKGGYEPENRLVNSFFLLRIFRKRVSIGKLKNRLRNCVAAQLMENPAR